MSDPVNASPGMRYQPLTRAQQDAVTALFAESFTASEGAEEGQAVAQLAASLVAAIDGQDVVGLGAYLMGDNDSPESPTGDNSGLVGAIFFTRLRFSDATLAYLLAPVAVASSHQGQGIGAALIQAGLAALREQGVAFVTTYGDINFYRRVGFSPLAETVIQAPQPMSMPEGWLGQSLTATAIAPRAERPQCVPQFVDPTLW